MENHGKIMEFDSGKPLGTLCMCVRGNYQGCLKATAHGDITSYSAHLRRLLFCRI